MGEFNVVPNTTEVLLVRNVPMTGKSYMIINRDFPTPTGVHLLEKIDSIAFRLGENNSIIFVGKDI